MEKQTFNFKAKYFEIHLPGPASYNFFNSSYF